MGDSHILWIRVGALGDLLIATAALEESVAKFPDRVFWVLGSPLFLQLLEPRRWPKIQRVITVQTKEGQEYVDSYEANASQNEWTHLRRESSWTIALDHCDHVINHRIESYRYALVPFFRRIPTRVGSCPWISRFFYTHWSPWLGKDPDIHERDWHLLVACFSANGMRTISEARTWAANIIAHDPLFKKWRTVGLPDLRADIGASPDLPATKKLILINPTSSRREKAWPAQRFLTLVGRLRTEENARYDIRVIGAPAETSWLNEVEPGEFPIIQPRSLSELKQIVGRAHLLVTNTSSMQFIAAGTKTPTVTLMGRTNPIQWGPVGPNDVVVKGTVPIDFKGNIFEQDYAALCTLTVEIVHDKISQLLNAMKQTSP